MIPSMIPGILLIRNGEHIQVSDKDRVEHVGSFISREPGVMDILLYILKKSAVEESFIDATDKDWAGESEDR